MRQPLAFIFLAMVLVGCSPPPVGEPLLEDGVVTKIEAIKLLDRTTQLKDNDYLFQVPTNNLHQPLFADKQLRFPLQSAEFLIDKIRLHLPNVAGLDDAECIRTVGKVSGATIYILRPQKGEWSFVLKEDI